ncbi:MAG: hypothetical protein MZV70_58820 [Desulfobacterales bacterium]|nr:hypothetical protein [Desulfobacterales bacterium]
MQRQHSWTFMPAEELSGWRSWITDFLEFSKFEKQEYRPELKPFNIEMGVYGHIEAARATRREEAKHHHRL